MNTFRNRIRSNWGDLLKGALEVARRAGPTGILVFDLDSTVFDNRPRQARIVREFGQARGIEALTHCAPQHWTSGWDMMAAMVACGLPREEAEAVFPDAKAFWAQRFFTSEYCVEDIEIPGAPRFLDACVETGAQLAYVTGRHEAMRRGTVQCLVKCKMPVPNAKIHLLMKPTLQEHDDDWKRTAHRQLEGLGEVLAAFDNEPTHANDYAERFPRATVFHLDTDHSGRDVTIVERVLSVPDFQLA